MVLIYTPHITPRIQYVMNYVFEEQFGLEYKIINDEDEFINNKTERKIIYSKKNIGGGVYFFSYDLLFENDIKEFDLCSAEFNNKIALFKHDEHDALGFDVFAAIFYLLSRYEEYLQKPIDKFGNYDFKNSILHRLNCLHIPVVEQWVNMLREVLVKNFPSLQLKKHQAKFVLSFDVDVAYAYQNRRLIRTIGGLIKKIVRLNFSDLKDQLLTILHLRKDMFETYEYIFSKIKNNKAIFFFNMGSYSKYDKNPSHKNKTFRKLIKQISTKNLVGLHPSYASNSSYNLISTEKKWLEEIINEKITSSRQHYLKLKMPVTYNQLIENGIQNDFTIGYSSMYGFRAGTCKPFLFFDLKKNETTKLCLFPFAVMEGTLNDIMRLSVDESKKIISDLINVVCKYEGIFIPIWHNSTLSDKDEWKGWRNVFEFTLNEIEKAGLVNLFDA
jgi:uncharacterized protein DUF7033